jgi:DNA-binding NtrC family response regulator
MKPALPNRKILVVDDEEVVREVIGEFLEILEYEIVDARDGVAGLEALKKDEYRAAIADIRMPKLDGIEFLRKSRRIRPGLPVVIITGHGCEETRKEAMDAGAFGYLRKPFRYHEMKALLDRIAGERPFRGAPISDFPA